MKLFATLETSRGKVVSVSDNEQITATVYDGNLKAYSVIIEFTNIGDIEEPTMGAIVTTREWRNEPKYRRKYQISKVEGCECPGVDCPRHPVEYPLD